MRNCALSASAARRPFLRRLPVQPPMHRTSPWQIHSHRRGASPPEPPHRDTPGRMTISAPSCLSYHLRRCRIQRPLPSMATPCPRRSAEYPAASPGRMERRKVDAGGMPCARRHAGQP